ncbi:MAG TPA: hypothetical protein PKV72_07095, partial [Candidatus Peribacteria bacterium]|nr:hypothetical protein [Candidatus Peribacteria bacterium]
MRNRFALLTVAVFLLAGFAVYGSSLHDSFLTYDDDLFVLKHPLVTSGTWTDLPQVFSGFDAELYMPLTIASLKLDYAIAGANPCQFHLTSLLLHVLGGCLLTWLLTLVLKSRRIAFFLGLVFLLHPLNTEAVAWISARKDVLSTPFFLGSTLAYLYSQDRRSRNLMLLSLALFAVGLTAKYMIVTLPAFLALLDLLRGSRPDKAMAKRLVPFVGISVLFTLLAVAAKQTGLGAPALDVALLGGKTTLWYLRSFFFPEDLRVLYLQETPVGWTPEFLAPWLLLLLLAAVCWALRKRVSGLALGLAFFFIALIPTFPAAVKYGLYFAADHYAYLPMLGLLTGIGWLMSGAV